MRSGVEGYSRVLDSGHSARLQVSMAISNKGKLYWSPPVPSLMLRAHAHTRTHTRAHAHAVAAAAPRSAVPCRPVVCAPPRGRPCVCGRPGRRGLAQRSIVEVPQEAVRACPAGREVRTGGGGRLRPCRCWLTSSNTRPSYAPCHPSVALALTPVPPPCCPVHSLSHLPPLLGRSSGPAPLDATWLEHRGGRRSPDGRCRCRWPRRALSSMRLRTLPRPSASDRSACRRQRRFFSIRSCPIRSYLIFSDRISFPILSDPILSYLFRSHIFSDLIRSKLIRSHIFSDLFRSDLILSYPILSDPIRSDPIRSDRSLLCAALLRPLACAIGIGGIGDA